MKRGKFTTTLDESIIKEIKIRAIQEGCSANDLIEEAIYQLLNKYKPRGGETK